MSQQQTFMASSIPGDSNIQFLQGNNGGAVPPDPATHVVHVVGSGAVTVSGNAGTFTETISVTGGGLVWSDKSTSFSAASNNGYIVSNTATATLPASPSVGDSIAFIVNTTNLLTIQANMGQSIRVGTDISAVAGICVNQKQGDGIELIYSDLDQTWISFTSPQGTWVVT